VTSDFAIGLFVALLLQVFLPLGKMSLVEYRFDV